MYRPLCEISHPRRLAHQIKPALEIQMRDAAAVEALSFETKRRVAGDLAVESGGKCAADSERIGFLPYSDLAFPKSLSSALCLR